MLLESSFSPKHYFLSHVYIKMQGPTGSPCQKLKFKCLLCCCCSLGSIKIILNPISSGTTKWVSILCNCPFSFFFFLFFFYHAILLFEISLQTREELREALEAEMRAFAVDKVGHKLRPLFVQFLIWSVNQVKKSFKTHTICKRQRLLRSLSIFCKWCVF